MAVLVICGSGRGAGKTAVGCELIAAMPELLWVAVKVSPHEHQAGSGLWEELDSHSDKDTGRYLAAGARRSFLVSGAQDSHVELVVDARMRASLCDGLLVESNRAAADVVRHRGERAVTVAVLSGPEAEWKASLRECAGRADALVLANGLSPKEVESSFPGKPAFELEQGQWSVPELVRFVRDRLVG